MRLALLGFGLLWFTLSGCEPTRTSTAPKPEPAQPTPPPSDHIIMVEAGVAEASMGRWFIRYVIDKQTRTCWMMIGSSMSQLDCCVLRRATQTRHRVTWESDRSCAARGVWASPSPGQPAAGGVPPRRAGWGPPRPVGYGAVPGGAPAAGTGARPGGTRAPPAASGSSRTPAPSGSAAPASSVAPPPGYRGRPPPTAPTSR